MAKAHPSIMEAVHEIEHWLHQMPAPGEAVVRQAIVLRLLNAAGFDIWNPLEVVPEETNTTGNRADFLIRVGQGKFALELKGMSVTLGAAHYQQAATYAVNEGTRWAVVTNGRVWLVIDEHLPGRWDERVALKLELGQEGQTFAEDLADLLDLEVWRADSFERRLDDLRQRQQQRIDEARIHREKRPVVLKVMAEFRIPDFATAVAAAAEMNRITEAERDLLLRSAGPLPAGVPRPAEAVSAPAQSGIAENCGAAPAQELEFTYTTLNASARAIYRPADGTWTIKAGSTALNRLSTDQASTRALEKRRAAQIAAGQLEVMAGGLLRFIQDVEYTSPSSPALDISGAPKNGWDVWKDREGRSAQRYRPGL